jgi:hypothetical protein
MADYDHYLLQFYKMQIQPMQVFLLRRTIVNNFLEYLGYELLALMAILDKCQVQWTHGQHDYHYHQDNGCDKSQTEQSNTAALLLQISYFHG